MNPLPRYELLLTEDDATGVTHIALVDAPALERTWVALRAAQRRFAVKEHILYGPVAVPEQDIYRRDPKTGREYYVFFAAPSIKAMRDGFFRNGRSAALNVMHGRQNVRGAVVESWVVDDPAADKSRPLGFDLPVGTWMVGVKIDDPAFWRAYIETGKLRGFSLEGSFAQRQTNLSTNRQTKPFMNIALKLLAQAQRLLSTGAPAAPAQQLLLRLADETTYRHVQVDAQGQALEIDPNTGQTALLFDGAYLTPEGVAFSVADGVTSASATDTVEALAQTLVQLTERVTQLEQRLQIAPAAQPQAMRSTRTTLTGAAQVPAAGAKSFQNLLTQLKSEHGARQ